MSDSRHPSRTKIFIDSLVLRGIDPHHAALLAESLRQQLVLTLSDSAGHQGLLSASNSPAMSLPVLRLGRIPLTTGRAGARDFGAKVGRAIGSHVRELRSSGKGGAR